MLEQFHDHLREFWILFDGSSMLKTGYVQPIATMGYNKDDLLRLNVRRTSALYV